MKIKIPAVIDKKGRLSACLFRDENGKEHQDIGMLWEDMPEDVPTTRIDIEVAVNLEAIFRDHIIQGRIRKEIEHV
jgi:hypothetical protein